MNKHKNVLVLVDYQNDFCCKDGSLYVPNSDGYVLSNVLSAIGSNKYDHIIFTLDWHNKNDESFKEWPIHCVQYSTGAAINQLILDVVINKGISYEIFLKGTVIDHEEYGAFENGSEKFATNFEGTSKVEFDKDTKYYIAGLAGDYCVKQTYNNMIALGLDVSPEYDMIGWIGEPYEYEL